MLVIRMQRTGRKGHAQFRVVVQDSRRTPTSGKLVASLGHFNPHTKETVLNKEKASFYLEHGAQPSERVARLLKSEGVKLPKWVATPVKKTGEVKNADKRRSTRPASAEPVEKPAETAAPVEEAPAPEAEAPTAEATEEPVAEVPATDETAETAEQPAAEEAPAEETPEPAAETEAEAPAEEAEPEPAAETTEPVEGSETEPAVEEAAESSDEPAK